MRTRIGLAGATLAFLAALIAPTQAQANTTVSAGIASGTHAEVTGPVLRAPFPTCPKPNKLTRSGSTVTIGYTSGQIASVHSDGYSVVEVVSQRVSTGTVKDHGGFNASPYTKTPDFKITLTTKTGAYKIFFTIVDSVSGSTTYCGGGSGWEV